MDTSSLVLYHLAGASLRVLSLALVAFAALWLARVRSASIRHAVWTVILGAMLLLPLLMAVAPALPVWIRSNPPAAVPAQALPAFSPGGVTQPVAVRPDWRQAGLALYLAILLAALVRLAASCLVVRRLLRSALPIREKHAVELLESAQISVPMAAGFLTPRILLPSTWREWSPEKLDTVLAHELAHVRRKDPQIALAAALNKCILRKGEPC
jgi:beta-lactamase regulating signal transducer with metallopeptidase domain